MMQPEATTERGRESRAKASTRIVIVDSDRHSVDYMRHFLVEAGYQVESCASGGEAMGRISETKPDLVISEVLSPELDGFSFCREIKSTPETLRVRVVLASFLAAEDRAREAGADGFLLKPISEERLLERVRAALRARGA